MDSGQAYKEEISQLYLKVIEDSATIVNMLLCSQVIHISAILNMTGEAVIQMMIKCLHFKNEQCVPIPGGSITPKQIQDNFPWRASCQQIIEFINEYRSNNPMQWPTPINIASLKKSTNKKIKEKKKVVLREPHNPAPSLGKFHRIRKQNQEKDSSSKCLMISTSDLNDKQEDVLNEFTMCLSQGKRKIFDVLIANKADALVKIDNRADVPSIKRYSFSVGLHDRFFSSEELGTGYYTDTNKCLEMMRRFTADVWPPTQVTISAARIKDFNERLDAFRKEELKNSSLAASKPLLKKSEKYVKSETTTYYREGLNGRPDLVLINPKTKAIVGIAEFKASSQTPDTGNIGTYLKQAALYQILMGSEEGFLYIYPTGNGKFTPIIRRVSEQLIRDMKAKLINLKQNFHTFINCACSLAGIANN